MAELKELLHAPKSTIETYYDHMSDPWFKNRFSSSEEEKFAEVKAAKVIPSYMQRQGFIPRRVEDFGDGGAFPKIHIAKYPLDMGREKSKPGLKILPVTVDAHSNVVYDAIVRLNENSKRIVYSRHKDIVPKILKNGEETIEW